MTKQGSPDARAGVLARARAALLKPVRKLGMKETLRVSSDGLEASRRWVASDGAAWARVGLGTAWRAPISEALAASLIRHALDNGIDILDVADVYGPQAGPDGTGFSERVVRDALRGFRGDPLIVTKGGFVRIGPKRETVGNNRPDYLRHACEQSLSRLGVDAIPLYLLHRVDPQADAELTFGTLAALLKEGKVRRLGLCTSSLDVIRAAQRHFPVYAIQHRHDLGQPASPQLLRFCEEHKIMFMSQQPFDRGAVFGKRLLLDDVELRSDAQKARFALKRYLADSPNIVPIPSVRSWQHLATLLQFLRDGRVVATEAATEQGPVVPAAAGGREVESRLADVLRTRRVAHVRELFAEAPFQALASKVNAVIEDANRKINGGRLTGEVAHLAGRQDRGSLLLAHYPEIAAAAAAVMSGSPLLGAIRQVFAGRGVEIGLGMSTIRVVDPAVKEQTEYAPLHQDITFVGGRSYNCCIPITGYGGDYPGLDFFLGFHDEIYPKELEQVLAGRAMWTPVAGPRDLLIFDGFVPHRRSIKASRKPRVNLEVRIFEAASTPSNAYPVLPLG